MFYAYELSEVRSDGGRISNVDAVDAGCYYLLTGYCIDVVADVDCSLKAVLCFVGLELLGYLALQNEL